MQVLTLVGNVPLQHVDRDVFQVVVSGAAGVTGSNHQIVDVVGVGTGDKAVIVSSNVVGAILLQHGLQVVN